MITVVQDGQTPFYSWLKCQFYLFSFVFFFSTAVVNLDNSVVDLETLQALYENVSNRRKFMCEYIIHMQYLPVCTSRLIALMSFKKN